MKEPKYTRKGKSIKNLSTGEVEGFKSINLAKKESSKLQRLGGGSLGDGTIKVIPHSSKKKSKAS